MSLPITTPEIITHLTGLKNGIDFSTTFTDGLVSSGSVYIDSWYSDVTQPTDAEILAAQDEVESLIESQEYIEKRKAEYPSIADLVVALYDTDDKAALATKRAAVKTKWPKDNSGPVE